jgi:phage antirepressor YoqD-like protein
MKWHRQKLWKIIVELKSAKHEVFKNISVKAHTWMTMAKCIISCTSTWITLMSKATNNGVMNVEEQNKQQWHEEH